MLFRNSFPSYDSRDIRLLPLVARVSQVQAESALAILQPYSARYPLWLSDATLQAQLSQQRSIIYWPLEIYILQIFQRSGTSAGIDQEANPFDPNILPIYLLGTSITILLVIAIQIYILQLQSDNHSVRQFIQIYWFLCYLCFCTKFFIIWKIIAPFPGSKPMIHSEPPAPISVAAGQKPIHQKILFMFQDFDYRFLAFIRSA